MKKKLILVASSIALLFLMLPASIALAQSQESSTETQPAIKDGLAIVAPRVAAVGKEVSMTVFKCSDQTPIEGSGVWMFTPEKAQAVKEQFSTTSRQNNSAAQEEALNINGTFLGRTDASGKVWYRFNREGRYVLATFKPGYWPDWRIIAVGNKPLSRSALVIDAPRKVEIGEHVTIKVNERGTQEPIKDAKVWAVTREQTSLIKNEISGLRESGDQTTLQAEIENSLNLYGIYLGSTNGDGKVHYAFQNTGGYLLIGYKFGYWPGLRPILVVQGLPKTTSAPDLFEIK